MRTIVIKKMTKDFALDVDVQISKQLYIRIWIGKQLIRLASRVMGCGINYTEATDA